MNSLEEFACYLFGSCRFKKINLLQFHLFQKSYKQKEEITDLALRNIKTALFTELLRRKNMEISRYL